ncbi:hypothetical protein E8E14_008319 [Neopestalotiopsis sp. 37M]|nr:hypothetical protein E8E14_008319 [Neopestalotiopsis sp. 37M]
MERIYGSNEFQGQSSRPAQQQQNRRPPRSGQNHFPPPSAVPSYAGRDLPPLPPKSASSSSSVYNSDGSCRATPSRFHRHESPLFMFSGSGSRAESRGSGAEEETGFGGSVNEDGMAMIRPPGMSIVTHFGEQQQQQQQHTVILSPRPRHPDHKIVKDLEQNDGGFADVSPILSPPTGTFSYQAHEVSPLTPEDSSSFRSFGQHTVSEVDHHEADGQKKQNQHNQQHWATTGDGGAVDSGGSRRQSRWEDIPPAASHSSLGFHPISTTEETNKTRMMATGITNNTSKAHNHRHYQPQFRHSDPGSPLAETSASSTVNHSAVGGGGGKVQRAFMLAAPKPYLQTSSARRANPQEPRPRSENNYIKFDTKPTTTTAPPAVTDTTAADHDDEEEIITSPYSLWTKGYGATAANTTSSSKQQSTTSPAPSGTSSSRNVSFAIKETPAFSKRTRAGSKPKPVPLHLHGGSKGALDDHVKTPYPEGRQKQQQQSTTTMVSFWDYDDGEQVGKDNIKPKRTSWGRSVDRNNNGGGGGSKGGPGPTEGGWGGASNSNGGGSGSKSRAMGKKLVSRVRNAGEDVMSRFSFSSEEAKREKRAEELRGKIQHHDPRREQQNHF